MVNIPIDVIKMPRPVAKAGFPYKRIIAMIAPIKPIIGEKNENVDNKIITRNGNSKKLIPTLIIQ
jgi:hypothetical protein